MSKQTIKKVKAFAVVNKRGSFYVASWNAMEAHQLTSLPTDIIVPCTITYSLPTLPKRKKKIKRNTN